MDPNNPNQSTNQPESQPQNTTPQMDTTQQTPPNQQPAPTTPHEAPITNQPDPNINQIQQPVTQTNPSAQVNSTPQANIDQPNPVNNQIQQPVAQTNINTQDNLNPQTDTDTSLTDGDYVENIGDSLIDLLDDINEDENLLQIVADEMELDKERVRETLSNLLDKIDQEQITSEELALIMASTVADEASNKE